MEIHSAVIVMVFFWIFLIYHWNFWSFVFRIFLWPFFKNSSINFFENSIRNDFENFSDHSFENFIDYYFNKFLWKFHPQFLWSWWNPLRICLNFFLAYLQELVWRLLSAIALLAGQLLLRTFYSAVYLEISHASLFLGIPFSILSVYFLKN